MITFTETNMADVGLPIAVWLIDDGQDSSIAEIYEWVEQVRTQINQRIDNQGGLLIRGFSKIETALQFQSFLQHIGGELRDYLGGTSPRHSIADKVMTATDMPQHFSIPMHQEMSYTSNPPDRIAFFCFKPASAGGYSTLADMRQITAEIPAQIMLNFTSNRVRLCRRLRPQSSTYDNIGVGKTWNEVFLTDDKAIVADTTQKKGWQAKWLQDDYLQLLQETTVPTKPDTVSGESIWFNQAHIFSPISAVKWAIKDNRHEDELKLKQLSPAEQCFLESTVFADGSSISEQDSALLFDIFERNECKVALQKRDILVLDNTRICHGRTPFVGERMIYTCLINYSAATS